MLQAQNGHALQSCNVVDAIGRPMVKETEVLVPFRVFVACPGDVASEKQMVLDIASELEPDAIERGLTIQVREWRQVLPGIGRPQSLILQDLPVDSWDVFLGILWLRFGLPPGAKDPDTGEDHLSG